MPTYFHLLATVLFAISSCTGTQNEIQPTAIKEIPGNISDDIRGISLPQGFSYVEDGDSAYSNWLLDLKLKKSKIVYLFNGQLKPNQDAQYGVLDIDIGKKDLVQCADAAMKLRADYLFEKRLYDQIRFTATSGDELSFANWIKGMRWKERGAKLVSYNINKEINNMRQEYNLFMQLVFSYCGTYSLSKQLLPVHDLNSIQPGDIFVQGGFPGHAVTVMAVAKNKAGARIFLLSQGYMPAQDIHILRNYVDNELSPWYSLSGIYPLYTPQWQFESEGLKRWE